MTKFLTLAVLLLALACTFQYPADCDKYDHTFVFVNNGFVVTGTFFCSLNGTKVEKVLAVNKKTPANKVTVEFTRGQEFLLDCSK